jgi:hypothetical protein
LENRVSAVALAKADGIFVNRGRFDDTQAAFLCQAAGKSSMSQASKPNFVFAEKFARRVLPSFRRISQIKAGKLFSGSMHGSREKVTLSMVRNVWDCTDNDPSSMMP